MIRGRSSDLYQLVVTCWKRPFAELNYMLRSKQGRLAYVQWGAKSLKPKRVSLLQPNNFSNELCHNEGHYPKSVVIGLKAMN
jgi:ribosomal protein L32E